MRKIALLVLVFGLLPPLHAAEPCMVIHGRAHLYTGDGQLRIWHIGTHHEYAPDSSSSERVIAWLEAGVPGPERPKYAIPAGEVYLFADFLICPTEPFKKGAAQGAAVKSATHRHYVKVTD